MDIHDTVFIFVSEGKAKSQNTISTDIHGRTTNNGRERKVFPTHYPPVPSAALACKPPAPPEYYPYA